MRVKVASKLDASEARWVVREKAKAGAASAEIAEDMGVSKRMVQYLWARFRHTKPEDIECPTRRGMPQDGLPGRTEHAAVVGLHAQRRTGAPRRGARIGRKPACAYRTTKYTAL